MIKSNILQRSSISQQQSIFLVVAKKASATFDFFLLFVCFFTPVSETLHRLCSFQGLSLNLIGPLRWSLRCRLRLQFSDNLKGETEMTTWTHKCIYEQRGQYTCKTNFALQKYHATQAEGFLSINGMFYALSATTNFPSSTFYRNNQDGNS